MDSNIANGGMNKGNQVDSLSQTFDDQINAKSAHSRPERREEMLWDTPDGLPPTPGAGAVALGIARVSTRAQQEEGLSLGAQEDKLSTYMQQMSWTPYHRMIREQVSGAEVDRQGFDQALEIAAAGEIDVVVLAHVDRFERDELAAAILRAQLASVGVALEIVDRPRSDPASHVILDIERFYARQERLTMRRRLVENKRRAARAGWVVIGVPPYGYDLEQPRKKGPENRNRLKENPQEANWVRCIYRWYVYDGLSLAKIGARLTEMGAPTRKGGLWSQVMIRRIITNEVYVGRLWYSKTKELPRLSLLQKSMKRLSQWSARLESGQNMQRTQVEWNTAQPGVPLSAPLTAGKSHSNIGKSKLPRTRQGATGPITIIKPREDWILITGPAVPALIEEDLFVMAQQIRKFAVARSPRNLKHQYILRGRARCLACGAWLYVSNYDRIGKPAGNSNGTAGQAESDNYTLGNIGKPQERVETPNMGMPMDGDPAQDIGMTMNTRRDRLSSSIGRVYLCPNHYKARFGSSEVYKNSSKVLDADADLLQPDAESASPRCPTGRMMGVWLEDLVWETLESYLQNPALAGWLTAPQVSQAGTGPTLETLSGYDRDLASTRLMLDSLRERQQRVSEKKDRIVALHIERPDLLPKAEMISRVEPLKSETEELVRKVHLLEAELALKESNRPDPADVEAALRSLRARLVSLSSPNERAEVLAYLDVAVHVAVTDTKAGKMVILLADMHVPVTTKSSLPVGALPNGRSGVSGPFVITNGNHPQQTLRLHVSSLVRVVPLPNWSKAAILGQPHAALQAARKRATAQGVAWRDYTRLNTYLDGHRGSYEQMMSASYDEFVRLEPEYVVEERIGRAVFHSWRYNRLVGPMRRMQREEAEETIRKNHGLHLQAELEKLLAAGPIDQAWLTANLHLSEAIPQELSRESNGSEYKKWPPKPPFLPYEEARTIVRTLHLSNRAEYRLWSRSGVRPASIPADPLRTYKGNGWLGWADFLGSDSSRDAFKRRPGSFLPFADARRWAQSLGLRTRRDYETWCALKLRPKEIPYYPHQVYANVGWLGWADWLGSTTSRNAQRS